MQQQLATRGFRVREMWPVPPGHWTGFNFINQVAAAMLDNVG